MAHYRKIDVRIWNDAKFISLSNNGKLIFLFLITHPGMTALGAMRTSLPGLAAELDMKQEAFDEAFHEALEEGMVKANLKASCIWLPNFLKYQSAESPNVIKNWIKQLEFIPECNLKNLAIIELKTFVEGLSEGYRKAFNDAFPKDILNTVSSKQLAVIPNQGEFLPSQDRDLSNTKILNNGKIQELRSA